MKKGSCELCLWLEAQADKVSGADSQKMYALVLKAKLEHWNMHHPNTHGATEGSAGLS